MAARGLDIPKIQSVIHYDVARSPQARTLLCRIVLHCTGVNCTLSYRILCTKSSYSTNPFCFLPFLLFLSYLFLCSPLQSSFLSLFPSPSIILLLPFPPPPPHYPLFISTSPSPLIFFSIILPQLYIHRSGRTARANSTGTTVSLVAPEDAHHHNEICTTLDTAGVKEMVLYCSSAQLAIYYIHYTLHSTQYDTGTIS